MYIAAPSIGTHFGKILKQPQSTRFAKTVFGSVLTPPAALLVPFVWIVLEHWLSC